MGSPGGFAVDGDKIISAGPHGRNKGLEATGKQGRIDLVHQIAQPAGAGDTIVEVVEPPEENQVVIAPRHDLLEIIATGDRGVGDQQKHLVQWIGDPPALTVVVNLSEMLQ